MDSNKIEGATDQVAGKLKEGLGSVLGDRATEAEGKAQQFGGQAQSAYGDALDSLRDVTADQPLLAVGVAVGVGFLLGVLVARL